MPANVLSAIDALYDKLAAEEGKLSSASDEDKPVILDNCGGIVTDIEAAIKAAEDQRAIQAATGEARPGPRQGGHANALFVSHIADLRAKLDAARQRLDTHRQELVQRAD